MAKGPPHPADVAMGRALRRRREMAGLSLADVAPRLGRPYQMVQRYENADVRLSYSKLTEIAVALECSPSELVADAAGEIDDFEPTIRKSLFRLELRISKIPTHRRRQALDALLETAEQFLSEPARRDEGKD